MYTILIKFIPNTSKIIKYYYFSMEATKGWSSWLWRSFNTAEVPDLITGSCIVQIYILLNAHWDMYSLQGSQLAYIIVKQIIYDPTPIWYQI